MNGHIQSHPSELGLTGRILASILPEIPCADGCSLCCEVPCSMTCDRETGASEIITTDFYREGSCGQLQNGQCLKFNDRVFNCRIFFKFEGQLPCFGGKQPEHQFSKEALRRFIWCLEYGTVQDALALKVFFQGEITDWESSPYEGDYNLLNRSQRREFCSGG